MANTTKVKLFEAYYRVKITGYGEFRTQNEKFLYMRSLLKAITVQKTYLDIVSAKFVKDGADIVIGSYVKYDPQTVREYILSANQVFGHTMGVAVAQISNGRVKLGAFNTSAPKMYRVIVSGRKERLAFPDDGAKKYYVILLKKALENMPLEVVSYSIVNNAAYFCILSLDQVEISVKRYLQAVNKAYITYYHQNFAPVGNLFTNKINIAEISGDDILSTIAEVHAQPIFMGLAQGYTDYRFSSYNDKPNTGVSQFDMLTIYIALNNSQFTTENADYDTICAKIINDYNVAHASVKRVLFDNYVAPEKDNFHIFYDQARAAYRAYDANNISQEKFASIIIELNEIGDYTFDEIFERITAPLKSKKAALVDVISEMAIKKMYTYDQIISKLGVELNGDSTLAEVVLKINMDKGYSYDYIMAKLGLAYPNMAFLGHLIAQMADSRGFPKVTALKELGIYDPAVVDELMRN